MAKTFQLKGGDAVTKMMRELPTKMRVSAKNSQLKKILKPYLLDIREKVSSHVSGETSEIDVNKSVGSVVARTAQIGVIMGALKRDKNSFKLRFIERGFAGKVRITPKPMFRTTLARIPLEVPGLINKDFEATVEAVVKRHRRKIAMQ